jgi:hypothetical protein
MKSFISGFISAYILYNIIFILYFIILAVIFMTRERKLKGSCSFKEILQEVIKDKQGGLRTDMFLFVFVNGIVLFCYLAYLLSRIV